MSQANIKNTAIFVTVLSVYLGLSLIGAPPHILAQQTENFNRSSQNNFRQYVAPTAEQLLASGFFVVPVADLINDLRDLSSIKKFEITDSTEFFGNYEALVRNNGFGFSGKGSRNLNRYTSIAFSNAVRQIILPIDKNSRLFLPQTRYNPIRRETENFTAAKQTVSFEYNKIEFTAKTSFEVISTEKAASLAAFYNQIFATALDRETPHKVFYQNTTATFENNQVFIVTRLPRASIDEFLKEDAKASEK